MDEDTIEKLDKDRRVSKRKRGFNNIKNSRGKIKKKKK